MTACAPRSETAPGAPGAPSAIQADDPGLQKAVAHVLAERGLDPTGVALSSATRQVVQGSLYSFVIDMPDGSRYGVDVLDNPAGDLSKARFASQ